MSTQHPTTRRTLAVAGAAAALVGSGMIAAAPTASAAEARDGTCESGEFCLYYNSDHQGSVSDFDTSIPDYGASQPSCYEYRGAGNGKGKCVKNDAASAWNRTGEPVTLYFNSNYGGATQTFAPGAKVNLNATLKNDNASHKIGGGGGTPPGSGEFLLPFPCGETWEAGTRSNHSPANAVDFNHYPDDDGWKVHSSAPGTVSKVADLGNTSYGKYIVIDHAGGYQTLYAHLKSQEVTEGQEVSAKTFIGRVGTTGGSTGPHLHYEQKKDGTVQRATFTDGNPTYWGTTNLARESSCP